MGRVFVEAFAAGLDFAGDLVVFIGWRDDATADDSARNRSGTSWVDANF
jgi:hypothetical protein